MMPLSIIPELLNLKFRSTYFLQILLRKILTKLIKSLPMVDVLLEQDSQMLTLLSKVSTQHQLVGCPRLTNGCPLDSLMMPLKSTQRHLQEMLHFFLAFKLELVALSVNLTHQDLTGVPSILLVEVAPPTQCHQDFNILKIQKSMVDNGRPLKQESYMLFKIFTGKIGFTNLTNVMR